jgi:hypothetical protein
MQCNEIVRLDAWEGNCKVERDSVLLIDTEIIAALVSICEES